MARRIERFNVTDDGAIVTIHPQARATSKVGTVVARIEPWVSAEGKRAIVDALNAGRVEALTFEPEATGPTQLQTHDGAAYAVRGWDHAADVAAREGLTGYLTRNGDVIGYVSPDGYSKR